jgi:hypothetical protein
MEEKMATIEFTLRARVMFDFKFCEIHKCEGEAKFAQHWYEWHYDE